MSTLLVTGSRMLVDVASAREYVEGAVACALTPGMLVVHGAAMGPDTWADGCAMRYGERVIVCAMPSSAWPTPLARNEDMVAHAAQHPPARCVAFRHAHSRTHGTDHTIRLARKAGIPCEVHTWDGRKWRVEG